MQSMDVEADCCMGDEEDPKAFIDDGSDEKDRGSALTWWFRACCFCYSAVGMDMAWRLGYVNCHCASYPWRVEASLLLLQGCLSFMHDAYFAGRSPLAKAADRCCASFLTLCQPLKLTFCSMDAVQLCLLSCSWTLGLLCFKLGGRHFAAGNARYYQIYHTLWHIMLPLGGLVWIEYTRLSVLLRYASQAPAPSGADLDLLWEGGAGPDCLRRSGGFFPDWT